MAPAHGHDHPVAPMARRDFLRRAGAAGLVVASASALAGWNTGLGAALVRAPSADAPPADPQAALARLVAGNRRFVRGNVRHPFNSDERRRASAEKQTPFAAVLCCSDSRVPPEMVFDQGLGALFVVRVAGNIAGTDELASLAYAAEHVNVDLIFVLGHEGCGAVDTTIKVVETGADAGEYAVLTDAIAPAVRTAKATGATGAALLPASVEENVKLVTAQIPAASPGIAAEIARREIAVVGGVYHLATGKVVLLP